MQRILKAVTSTLSLSIAGIVLIIISIVFFFWYLTALDVDPEAEATAGVLTLTTCGLGLLIFTWAGINLLPRGVKMVGAVSLILLIGSPFLFVWILSLRVEEESVEKQIEEIARTLDPGTPITAFAEPDQEYSYTFEGKRDRIVTIEMQATDETFDSKLILEGPFGETLVETPDDETGPNAKMTVYLAETGSYKIIAQGMSETESEYELSMNFDQEALPQIEIGEEKLVDPAENFVWSFQGTSAQSINLELRLNIDSTDSDTHQLILRGPGPTDIIAQTEGITTTQLNNILLSQDAPYTITIMSAGSVEDYLLTLKAAPQPPEVIEFGVPVTDNISNNTLWTFNGEAGQIVTVEMNENRSSPYTSSLTLRGPDGTSIVESHDSGNSTDLFINNQVLLETGLYSIVPGGIGDSGAYTLTLVEIIRKEIEFDEIVNADTTDRTIWTFQGETGQIVTIEMKEDESSIDTHVTLRGPDGTFIASNDNSGNSTNSLINNQILPEDGPYFIAPSTNNDNGAYTLILSFGEPDPNDPREADLFQAQGRAYAQQKDYQQAVAEFTEADAAFKRAIALDDDNPSYYNSSCRFGSLLKHPEDVLEDCEKTIELAMAQNDANLPSYLDSRGLARALTGDTSGAIEDFQTFVTWTKDNSRYDPDGIEREGWIQALENGEDPFTESVLDELRNQ